jgi:hypothetical protein
MSLTVSRLTIAVCGVVLAVVFSSSVAQAEHGSLEGHTARAEALVNLRDGIPVGPFSNSNVLEIIQPGELVTVLERKDIVTLARTDQWLRVRRHTTATIGWVYNGILGEAEYFQAAD